MYTEKRTLAYNLANFARARNSDVFRRGTSLPDSSYGQLMTYSTYSFFEEKKHSFFISCMKRIVRIMLPTGKQI